MDIGKSVSGVLNRGAMGNVGFGPRDSPFFLGPRKSSQQEDCKSVPQTDTGELVEYTKVDERTSLKELGKLARRNLGRCLFCILVLVSKYGTQIKTMR